MEMSPLNSCVSVGNRPYSLDGEVLCDSSHVCNRVWQTVPLDDFYAVKSRLFFYHLYLMILNADNLIILSASALEERP